jgi:hypothetical protein
VLANLTLIVSSLLYVKEVPGPSGSYLPAPDWETMPSGMVQLGVGIHVHEKPVPTWAFDFDLGPEFAYADLFTLRPALGYGLDVNATNPVEQYATVGLGIGVRVPYACSFEYMPAAQLGAYQGEFEPAFRHSLAWRMFYYAGFVVQHFVTGTDPALGHPRQAMRVMLSVDVARLIAYRFL